MSPKNADGVSTPLVFHGGWLFTCPEEDFGYMERMAGGNLTGLGSTEPTAEITSSAFHQPEFGKGSLIQV